MKKIKVILKNLTWMAAAAALFMIAGNAHATDGGLDTSFALGAQGGVNSLVRSTITQSDGKIIILGDFTAHNGMTKNRITRINADGTMDMTFNSGTGANGIIYSAVQQSDGKIVIGGNFTTYNGVSKKYIARLNADGSLDTSFNSGTGANDAIFAIALQSDGKIIFVGGFTIYNGTTINRIARLNPDGTLDATFNVGTGFNTGNVRTLAIQSDGKILVGGGFGSFNGTARNRIARLNANGSIDMSFDPGSGVSTAPYGIAVQADGRIIMGGSFTAYNGIARNYIVRINDDGTLDTSFDPGTGFDYYVQTVSLQSDGKIVVGGLFTSYNGVAQGRISRLNTDATIDEGFDPDSGANDYIYYSTLQADGKIMVMGNFTEMSDTTRSYVARLNANGSLDTTFDTGAGAKGQILSSVLQPDGKIFVGGGFTAISGASRNRIARLNADGSADMSFNPGTGANSLVRAIVLQPDGKILIGGDFSTYDGTSRNRIARLNADGTLDTSFDPGTGANAIVCAIALQSDGKIVVGGSFTSYNGTIRNMLARINSDGSFDDSFTGYANATVRAIALQSDGKIMIGGSFTTCNGVSRKYIARVDAGGSLDATFNTSTGMSAAVYTFNLQPDGKILVGGSFTTYKGTAANRIIRLNSDSSIDTTFVYGTGSNGIIWTIVMQPDGKYVIGGIVTLYNGTSRNRILRINADGSNDSSFDPGLGADSYIYTLSLQTDGKIIAGGEFNTMGEASRSRVARVNADGSVDTEFNTGGGGSAVYAVATQADGSVMIGGNFTTLSGTNRNYIARVYTSGALDTSFDPGTGTNAYVRSIALQNDNKVIIGGDFTTYNGTARSHIARVNANGTLDTSFDPGEGANGTIRSSSIQSDGKILIGGDFTTYNGTARNHVARLNSNGTLDSSFDASEGANNVVRSISVQSNGKVIIGGDFTTYSGTTRNRIARLNANGTLDTSFDPGTGMNGNMYYVVKVQPDDKVLVGGDFTIFNGTNRSRIARLNSDGTLDTSFNPGTGMNGTVNAITVQTDNKIICAGDFTIYNGTAMKRVVRVTTDGTLDTDFNPGTGANNAIYAMTAQTSSKVFIGGSFVTYNSVSSPYLARLNLTVPPVVTTAAATSIEATTAALNANLTDAGGEAPTRSFEWGTATGAYTGSCTVGTGSEGAYSCNATSLIPSTLYYYHAIVSNSAGTAYGTEMTFTTGITTPTTNTQSITSIGTNAATGNGAILDTGGENPTRYMEWGTVSGTYINSCSAGTGGTGAYSCSMAGLSANTTYYVRAKATNSIGATYGTETSFTTAASFTCGGDVVSYGGKNYTTVQIGTQCWFKENLNVGTMLAAGTTLPADPAPTLNTPTSVSKWCYSDNATNCTNEGGLYTWAEANALASACNTTSCAKTTNQGVCPTGWHIPGDGEYKTMEMQLGMTQEQADATSWRGTDEGSKLSTLTLGGNNSSGFTGILAGRRYTDSSFELRGTYAYLWSASEISALGGWYRTLISSSAAVHRSNTTKTNGFSVRCIKTIAPTATTSAVSNIAPTTVTGNANVTNAGGDFVSRTIEYGTMSGVYTNSCSATAGEEGNYSCNITSLAPNTTYYLRAKIVNAAGTAYGSQTSFTTLVAAPTVTTQAATSINTTFVTGNGNVTAAGGENPARYIEWGTVSGTYTNSCSSGTGAAGAYTCLMTGLAPNVKYYVRAKATNSAGTTYGSEVNLTTLIATPVVSTASETGLTATSATANGNVTSTGGSNPARTIEWGIASGAYTNTCDAGTGPAGTFSCNIIGLAPNTTYYAVAKATNSAGTAYGVEISFTTLIASPSVTTSATTSITATSAMANADVTSIGGENPNRYIEYGTASGAYTQTCDAGTGAVGAYTCSLVALNPDTAYYLRAKTTNSAGTGYGSEVGFTTPALPIITIANPNVSAAQSKMITASADKGTLTQSITTESTCDSSLTFTAYSSITFSSEDDNGKKVCYQASDVASGISYLMSNAISGIDVTAPTGSTALNAGATITSSATTTINNSVTGATEMRFKNETGGTFSGWLAYAASYAWSLVAGDGLKTIYAEFRDSALNVFATSDTITLDTLFPTITITNPNTSAALTKTITASTNEGTLTQSVTAGAVCNATLTFTAYSSTTFSTEADNGKKVCYKAIDSADNIFYQLSDPITNIDTTAPEISADNDSDSWQTANPTIALVSTDANLDYSKYIWDNNDCANSGTLFTDGKTLNIPSEGIHTLYLCNMDIATNTSSWNGTYKLDTIAPAITAVTPSCTNTVDPTFTVTATDSTSGIDTYSFDSGATWQNENTKTYTDLTHVIPANAIQVKDHAGNISQYATPITQTCVASPTVATQAATNITKTTATANANIIANGNQNPSRTIEWGASSDSYTSACNLGAGPVGPYSCPISGLTPDTIYYVRAKAANSSGTSFGEETTFRTLPTEVTITNPDATKMANAVNSGYATVDAGTINATPQVTTVIDIILQSNNATLSILADTQITNTDSGNFDFQDFTTQNITSIVKQSVAESVSAVQIGLSNTKLSFSQMITMVIDVDPAYNGETLNVFYQNEGETAWHFHTTCLIANGKCAFTTDHATTYSVNGNGSMNGTTGINLNTDVQEIISLDCGSTAINLGNITPGTPITGSSTCTATTNANGGYTLSVKRDDATSTLKKDTENSVTISDLTPWDPTTPNSNTWSGNGLGFTVYHSTANKNASWWGTGIALTDTNNKYAGFAPMQTDIMRHSAYSETSTATDIGYMVNVPPTQKSGAYSGAITYQVVTVP